MQEKKGEKVDLSEKLEHTVPDFVKISFLALVFLHGVPMEVLLGGLKIRTIRSSKSSFLFMPENTHTSPVHPYYYKLLWNDSLLGNAAEKGEGRCLKLIRKKEHFTCRRDINLPCLRLPKLFCVS